MIKIFGSEEKEFRSNGKVVISPLALKEYKLKSLNGWYIEAEVSIDYKEFIKKDELCLIKSKSKYNPQAFRIDEIEKNSTLIKFKANHVMFDSEDFFLDDVRVVKRNAINALLYINERTDKPSPFLYTSDIDNISTAYFNFKNLFEAWQVIEERWGGTFDADNWNIVYSNTLGKKVGEMIVYSKNNNDILITEDWSNVCTRVYAKGDNGLSLPEKYLDSEIQYAQNYVRKEDFPSSIESDLQPTEEELTEELRKNAIQYLQENQYPKVSYELSANINESFDVNDKIIVKHPLVMLNTEVQEYTYDHISKKTTNLVFGNYSINVKNKVSNIKEEIKKSIEISSQNRNLINNQTETINSFGKKGHLYITDNELYILDSIPIEKAKIVCKLSLGGLGFSKDGAEGPFGTAITLDGNINADYISSGHINTSLIEGYSELALQVGKIYSLTQYIKKELAFDFLHLKNTYESGGSINYLKLSNFEIRKSYPGLIFPSKYTYPGVVTFYTILFSDQPFNEIGNENIKEVSFISPIPLRTNSETSDQVIIQNNQIKVIQKIDKDNKTLLWPIEHEIIAKDNVGILPTFDENTYVTMKYFENIKFECEYIEKNELTKQFATTAEVYAQQLITEEGFKNVVKKAELATEISQTAEIIKFKNGHLIIEMDNFNLDLDGNVTLANGAKIIGGKGLLTGLQFVSTGEDKFGVDFYRLGLEAKIDAIKDDGTYNFQYKPLSISVDIPKNFTIESAYLTLYHTPISWADENNHNVYTGKSQNIAVYRAKDGENIKFSGWNYSDYIVILPEMNEIAYIGTPTISELGKVEKMNSVDIKSGLKEGNNILFIRTKDSLPSSSKNTAIAAQQTGFARAVVNIIGYQAFEKESD